jgi:hypothetical protein
MKVRYKEIVVSIKKKVLEQVCGHPVDILDRRCLTRCLAYQATLRSLHGKRTFTNGYKPKELRALSYR